MATNLELRQLFGGDDSSLLNRVEVGCIIAAEAIRKENAATENHANRLVWAKRAFTASRSVSNQMLMALLATNAAATVEQITGATDATINAAVAAAVNLFADGS